MPQKRSQPVSAPSSKSSGKHSKASKAKANAASSADANPASNSPPTPALTPSSSSTPPSSLSLARSSKKLSKAVRQGHHHGNGGHGGHSASGTKGTMKTKRAIGEGPEADWSGEDDEDDCISIVEEEVLVGEPAGKSAPKSEVSMHALLDGAKLRPEPQNISRGYELLTSPASRLVIPFDAVPSSPKTPFATRTGTIFGGAGYGVCSMPSSPGFSDDLEWEWEDLCFEMDGVDLATRATAVKGKKDAYAEVVKRAAV